MSTTHNYKTLGEKLYTLFKYTIYALLTYNIYLFFVDDYNASIHIFSEGITFANAIEAFTATIDTVNWVVLLLLFELETWVISDEVLEKKGVKWILMVTRAFCYSFIVYAVYGYFSKFFMLYAYEPFLVKDVCSMVDGKLAMIITMDEYVFLSAENCHLLQGLELSKITGQTLIADQASLVATQWLAWVDIINATAWLAVVVVLEVDVWCQLKGVLKGAIIQVSTFSKVVLYGALVLCAIYWGVLGGFLEFWDALLWIVAFVFIELNLFQWQQETHEKAAKA